MSVIRSVFPQDNRIWRLQWLGHPTLGYNPVEPDISTLLVDPAQKGNHPSTRRTCRIGMGSLPMLEVGSRWRNGKRMRYSKCPVFRGRVDFDQSGSPVSAAHKIQESPPRYMIPPMDHPLGAGDWLSTFCLRAPVVGKDCELIIPCTEILRAWFFRSRSLIVHLCKGPLGLIENEMFHFAAPRSKAKTGQAPLLLRRGLSISDGLVAAMIAYDETAARRLKQATDSIFRTLSTAEQSMRGIKALPPVQGIQPIQANGQWLTYSNKRRFLVYRLTGIGYPNQIRKIVYNLDTDNRSYGNDLPRHKSDWNIPIEISTSKTAIMSDWDDDPAQDRAERTEVYDAASFFNAPDMERLPVNPNKTRRSENTYTKTDDPRVSTAKASRSRKGPGVLGIQPKPERRSPMPRGFHSVLHIGRIINNMRLYTCHPTRIHGLPISSNGVPVSSFPFRNQEGHLLGDWSQVDNRARRLLALEIACGPHRFYCLEIETANNSEFYTLALVCRPNFEPIEASMFQELLLTCVYTEGVWPGDEAHDGLRIKKFKHSRPTPEDFAIAIIRQVENWIGSDDADRAIQA